MTVDIQFCSLVDSLQIVSAKEILDAVPRAIQLTTRQGFHSAQRVLISDYLVDTFTVIDDKHLIVYPPDDVFKDWLVSEMAFDVVSSEYSGGISARVIFGPTKNVKKVSGIQKLVQQVVKTLLSNSNSNKFSLGQGGNLLEGLGGSFTEASRVRLTAQVAEAVSRTDEQIKAGQQRAPGLAASERLLELRLGSVSFVGESVHASMKLVTYSGKSIDIPLAL